MNRRDFLRSASLLPAAVPAALAPAQPHHPWALPVRISCNLYSFNGLLRSGAMTLDEVLELCAGLGFDAVDPTGYYFPNYPDLPPDAYVFHIKRKAFRLGLDISGTGVRNDFTVPEESRRQADIAHVARWIGFAARLGAPVIRVFAGKGVPEGHTREEVTTWVADSLRQCAAYGSRHGVMVALQNHAEFIKTAAQIEAVLQQAASDWLGLILDIGSFRTEDPYEDIAEAAPYAVSWQIKENLTLDGREVKTDLDKIVQIVKASGYRGYLPIETLGEGDPREKVPRFLDEVRTALA